MYITFIILPESSRSINIKLKLLLTKVSRLAEKMINTSVFKRLKSIKQLQAVHEVFPTGNHTRSTFFNNEKKLLQIKVAKILQLLYDSNSKMKYVLRFEHSLGVMHLARSLCEALGASREDTHLVEVHKPPLPVARFSILLFKDYWALSRLGPWALLPSLGVFCRVSKQSIMCTR